MSNAGGFPSEIVDVDGYVHRLRPGPLGEGGQGVVFRTEDPNTAVKLVTDGLGRLLRDPSGRQRLCRKLGDVRLLPLPELHMAMPQALIAEPFAGYSMRLLSGMVPIKVLLAPPTAQLSKFYVTTGGLRRRLSVLAKLAETLVRLHSVPVVYADVSPNNIFVSEDVSASEVWLIDADNLHFLSTSGPTIYTPGFGAPEVVQGLSGVNIHEGNQAVLR